MHRDFFGENALIVGGNCEMGICLAQKLIEMGLYPTMTGRNTTALKQIQHDMGAAFEGRYRTLILDFSDPETIEMIPKKIYNTLDYMIDFVQGNYESLIAGSCHKEVYDYYLQYVAFRAVLLKKISRAMLVRRKGRMVYVSSTAALRPNPGQGFYASSKKAAESLYRNIGLELGDRGVTTVSLRAGYVEAGRGRDYLAQSLDDTLKNKRLTLKHITETILFLLSDSAEGFNATELVMDRGLTAGK
jgi:3-oxoacyl-[acyl-carrier protein] reductase